MKNLKKLTCLLILFFACNFTLSAQNVGIGTNNPQAKLDVRGNIALNDNQIRLKDGNDVNHYLQWLGGSFDGPKLNGNRSIVLSTNSDSKGVRIFGEGSGGTQLVVNANYDLGTLPPAESGLVVGASGGTEGGQIQLNAGQNGVAYMFDVEGSNLRILNGSDAGSSGLTGIFNQNGAYTASDARLKTVVGRSDASQDLQTLKQIQITDYTLNGDGPVTTIKKVLAQELYEVFPNAVYITNGLIDGEKISDFHLVDYDALSMLNISATQEQQRLIEQLQQENAALKNQVGVLNAQALKTTELEDQLTAIRAALESNGIPIDVQASTK
jgi:hypothetical protein